jgi:uncharacterized membrane protein
MSRFIVITFPTEAKAYEGSRALRELHGEGSISLYGVAVVAREKDGAVTIKQGVDEGPIGTALGMMVGGLVGLIGGPVGTAVGLSAGGLIGSMGDLINLGVSADFLDAVSAELTPGMSAVVAEIDEDWVTPLDTRIAVLGGRVLRQSRASIEDEILERNIEAARDDVKLLREEYAAATGKAKAQVKASLDAAEAKMKALSKRASDRATRLKNETDAKIKSLQQQAKSARVEAKRQIDTHIKDVQADFEVRSRKLGQALELTKEALTP